MAEGIVADVVAALDARQLDLPVMPDIAIRIRDALTNPNASLDRLIEIVSADPVVVVHVIKAANSSAFHGAGKVNTLRGAISRIGYRMLYGIVINLTLTNMFRAKKMFVEWQLRSTWRRSCEVAATCFVLAEREGLQPEIAMLAGLVHEIGALPLCLYVDEHPGEFNQTALRELIGDHARDISPTVLRHWEFPNDIIDIVAGYADPSLTIQPDTAQYVNVLALSICQRQSQGMAGWRNLHAAENLGFYPGDLRHFFAARAEDISEMQGLLGVR